MEMDSDLVEAGLWDAYYGRPRRQLGNTSTQSKYDDAYMNELETHS